jgi:hypothetical protein
VHAKGKRLCLRGPMSHPNTDPIDQKPLVNSLSGSTVDPAVSTKLGNDISS